MTSHVDAEAGVAGAEPETMAALLAEAEAGVSRCGGEGTVAGKHSPSRPGPASS